MTSLPRPTYRVFETMRATCERHGLIEPLNVVVAAVSGGVDSMMLLAFLLDYLDRRPFYLVAFHLHHMIRGEDADLDEQLVERFCLEHAVPYVSVRRDIPKMADDAGVSVETMGRRVRREELRRVGEEYAAMTPDATDVRIATGHHMDDRAESIVMHLGRGAGTAGAVGMRYRDGAFIHPALDCRRDALVAAAQAMDLPWREDPTNASREHRRNRIRMDVLPAWSDAMGHDVVEPLVRFGELVAADHDALDARARALYDDCLLPDGALSLAALFDVPPAVRARILQRFFSAWTGDDATLAKHHIDALSEAVSSVEAGEAVSLTLSLPNRVTATVRDGRLTASIASDASHDIPRKDSEKRIE